MSSDGEDGPRRPPEHLYMQPLHHDKGLEPHAYHHHHHHPAARYPRYSHGEHEHPPMGPPPPEQLIVRPHSYDHAEHAQSMGPIITRHYRSSVTSPLPLTDRNSPQQLDREGPSGPYPPPYGYGPSMGPPPPYGYYGGAYYPPGYPPPPQYSPYPPYGYPPVAYPSQQAKEASALQPGRTKSAAQTKTQPPDRSPSSMFKVPINPYIQQDMELERIRSQTEIKVAPIRTDFHFFVDDVDESVREEAENECGEQHKEDLFLLYSNMNARLIQKLKVLPRARRAVYMAKEEQDRLRFQNDDEIASRHCATLTARAKSPRDDDETDITPTASASFGDDDVSNKKRISPTDEEMESPPKRNKQDEEADNESLEGEKKAE